MAFFSSKGLKRRVATYLALALEVLRSIPGTAEIVSILETLVGILGGSAVSHAAVSGSLSKEKLAGVVSIIYAVIALAPFFPVLLPFLPYLYKAAALLSAVKVGQVIAK